MRTIEVLTVFVPCWRVCVALCFGPSISTGHTTCGKQSRPESYRKWTDMKNKPGTKDTSHRLTHLRCPAREEADNRNNLEGSPCRRESPWRPEDAQEAQTAQGSPGSPSCCCASSPSPAGRSTSSFQSGVPWQDGNVEIQTLPATPSEIQLAHDRWKHKPQRSIRRSASIKNKSTSISFLQTQTNSVGVFPLCILRPGGGTRKEKNVDLPTPGRKAPNEKAPVENFGAGSEF